MSARNPSAHAIGAAVMNRRKPAQIARQRAQALRWLGGVSLFNEAAWGPLAGRLKKKRRKRDI
jgi:hypothetical protein